MLCHQAMHMLDMNRSGIGEIDWTIHGANLSLAIVVSQPQCNDASIW